MRMAMAIGAAALLAACADGDQRMASERARSMAHMLMGHWVASSAAAPLVPEMQTLTQTLLAGTDANGDGTVSREESESGLAQSAQHIPFLQEGEGLA